METYISPVCFVLTKEYTLSDFTKSGILFKIQEIDARIKEESERVYFLIDQLRRNNENLSFVKSGFELSGDGHQRDPSAIWTSPPCSTLMALRSSSISRFIIGVPSERRISVVDCPPDWAAMRIESGLEWTRLPGARSTSSGPCSPTHVPPDRGPPAAAPVIPP